MLLSYSCSSVCELNYEIVESSYVIPYYYFQNKSERELTGIDYERFEYVSIKESEVPEIMEIINAQISTTEGATLSIIEDICDYSVQIAGVYDRKSKEKLIYLNFMCGYLDYEDLNEDERYSIGINRKETKFFHPKDGGDCHFQAEINTKTNKLRIIIVNGEA
jgi:hypothetical protein